MPRTPRQFLVRALLSPLQPCCRRQQRLSTINPFRALSPQTCLGTRASANQRRRMASRSVWALLGLLLLVLLLRQRGGFSVATTVLEPQRATQVLEQFTTASSDDWPGRSYGNHRARLRLDGGGLAWARVEWRLPGLAMQDRTLLLIDERTGSPVHNLHVVSASSEAAEILFEAKVWEDNPNPDPKPSPERDPDPNPDPDPGAAANRGRQREAAAAQITANTRASKV